MNTFAQHKISIKANVARRAFSAMPRMCCATPQSMKAGTIGYAGTPATGSNGVPLLPSLKPFRRVCAAMLNRWREQPA
jgi:hypothetical protein